MLELSVSKNDINISYRKLWKILGFGKTGLRIFRLISCLARCSVRVNHDTRHIILCFVYKKQKNKYMEFFGA
jgi:hypothetical protein